MYFALRTSADTKCLVKVIRPEGTPAPGPIIGFLRLSRFVNLFVNLSLSKVNMTIKPIKKNHYEKADNCFVDAGISCVQQ